MINPAEHLCRLNGLMKNLNWNLRDCSKEDKEAIQKVCAEMEQEIGNIKAWTLTQE